MTFIDFMGGVLVITGLIGFVTIPLTIVWSLLHEHDR